MSTAQLVDLYLHACNIGQSTRNDFIQLLSNPDMGNIVTGTCVRVLLELQDFSEDYMVARVQGVEMADPYTGFSQNANQATTIHLRLQLPSRFNGGNGNLYQLNSISNSPLTRSEVESWLQLTAHEGRPDAQSFIAAGNKLRAIVPARQRRTQQPPQHAPSHPRNENAAIAPTVTHATKQAASPPAASPESANNLKGVTIANRGLVEGGASPKPAAANPGGRSAAKAEMALKLGPRELVYQMILKEKGSEATLFKKTCEDMRTSELRTLERDVAEYLDRVREAIANNQERCVVCMDQIPTVIIMPCRHRVLCRWCTLKVECCPMCRGIATELFEPIEQ